MTKTFTLLLIMFTSRKGPQKGATNEETESQLKMLTLSWLTKIKN